jgi:anti-anti-sigma regulatory factor
LLAAAGHGAAILIIDMSGMTFGNLAGVQAIIDAHNQAAATRTQLRLAATAVRRILTLVGGRPADPHLPDPGSSTR